MAKEAQRAGKDVYVERPLCLTRQQGVDLLRAEAESRKIVQVGSQTSAAANRCLSMPPTTLPRDRWDVYIMLRAHRCSSHLHPHALRRGGVKLPEPLNFQGWQAAAATRVVYSPDRFLIQYASERIDHRGVRERAACRRVRQGSSGSLVVGARTFGGGWRRRLPEITPYGYRRWDAGSTVPAVQRSLLNGPEEAARQYLAAFLNAVPPP